MGDSQCLPSNMGETTFLQLYLISKDFLKFLSIVSFHKSIIFNMTKSPKTLNNTAEASPGWLNYGLWSELAADQGAAMFLLEHRYTGWIGKNRHGWQKMKTFFHDISLLITKIVNYLEKS